MTKRTFIICILCFILVKYSNMCEMITLQTLGQDALRSRKLQSAENVWGRSHEQRLPELRQGRMINQPIRTTIIIQLNNRRESVSLSSVHNDSIKSIFIHSQDSALSSSPHTEPAALNPPYWSHTGLHAHHVQCIRLLQLQFPHTMSVCPVLHRSNKMSPEEGHHD